MKDKDRIEVLRATLQQIENWELPETGHFWDVEKTRPKSYEWEYGSNGAKEFIRGIARAALRTTEEQEEKMESNVDALKQLREIGAGYWNKVKCVCRELGDEKCGLNCPEYEEEDAK